MVPPTDPVKDAMVQARKQQILEAAVAEFAEKGFHKTTIKAIARRAGVADGTIYNYFSSKQDLMVAIVMEMAQLIPLVENVKQMADTSSVDEILSVVLADRLHVMSENLAHARAIFPQVVVQPELQARFCSELLIPNLTLVENIMAQHVKGLDLPEGVGAQVATRIVFAIIFGSLFLTLLGDEFAINNQDEFVTGATALVRAALSGGGEAAQ